MMVDYFMYLLNKNQAKKHNLIIDTCAKII